MLLYLHVPFCARRCSYCDFAIAVRRETPSAAYTDAVLREWLLRQDFPAWETSPQVETIYLGGGTPSRLEPAALGTVLDRIRTERPVAAHAEITLEANPDDVTSLSAEAWLAAGVNRISLGAQSFSPVVLAWMHRTHPAEQIATAVGLLRRAGVANLSLDLIYGLPSELGHDWAADLERALALEPEHLSLYALTVEPRTPLGRWSARGEVVPAPDERAALEFLSAHHLLGRAGFEHYEVSNAARPGYRARHNAGSWRREPVLGLGPSAHSAAGRTRAWNLREWEAYRRIATAGGDPREAAEELTDAQVALEERYLGLRTDAGLPASQLAEPDRARWVAAGWASLDRERVRLTPEGWLRLDALVASLPDES